MEEIKNIKDFCKLKMFEKAYIPEAHLFVTRIPEGWIYTSARDSVFVRKLKRNKT